MTFIRKNFAGFWIQVSIFAEILIFPTKNIVYEMV